jgi:small-conductance mechanosensitive channel
LFRKLPVRREIVNHLGSAAAPQHGCPLARMRICGNEARLWPHFAAISTRARAWLVLHMGLISIRRGTTMFEFQDLFQWDRFITPTIIKTFYWLVIALICLFGLSGIFSGLAAMAISPFSGFLVLLSSIASVVVGIVFSRIVAEFILIVFRINEHLGAIRDQGGMR